MRGPCISLGLQIWGWGEGATHSKQVDLIHIMRKGSALHLEPHLRVDGSVGIVMSLADGEEEEDDSIPRCPLGHKLREDTNSNRFGCTADDCHRKNDPNIIGRPLVYSRGQPIGNLVSGFLTYLKTLTNVKLISHIIKKYIAR